MIKRKYKINDNFFEKIDTEVKAYILGLMYADGCVYSNKNQTKYAKLDLKSDDKYLLEIIAKEMNNECPIKTHTYNRKEYFSYQDKTYEFVHSMSRLQMRSDKVVDDLIKLGCSPKKTFNIMFPSNNIVPKDLLRHFIRGYFDGDGSISYSERKSNSKTRNIYLHFILTFTGTYDFISSTKKYINDNVVNFTGDIRSRWDNNKNNYTLSIDGNDIIQKILDWIYEDSHIYLKRKYEKYKLLQEEIINRTESKKYSDAHRNPIRKEPFNIYKNGVYIGTCDNRRKLERESENILGEHISRISLTRCLKKIDNNYHGYMFVFVSDDKKITNINYICCGKENLASRRKIIQYDLHMNFIKRWDSIKEAYEFLGISEKSSGITCCCNGKQKTAYGYIWRYTD